MPRILVIADETRNRDAAVAALRSARLDVVHAPEAKSGITLARQLGVDLILCDVNGAERDALWLLEQARKDTELSGVPIIVLAAKDDRIAYRKAMKLGADDYLVKPCSAEDLVESALTRMDKVTRIRSTQSVSAVAPARTATMTLSSGLSAEIREATVLFADMRDFDAIAARLSTDELSQLLQKFFGAVCEPIAAQGAWSSFWAPGCSRCSSMTRPATRTHDARCTRPAP
jgi:DNA-binding response OmpR family regulator